MLILIQKHNTVAEIKKKSMFRFAYLEEKLSFYFEAFFSKTELALKKYLIVWVINLHPEVRRMKWFIGIT